MRPLPPEIADFLPSDIARANVASWAWVGRDVDGVHEALVLRLDGGEPKLLTRGSSTERFVVATLAPGASFSLVDGPTGPRLVTRVAFVRDVAMTVVPEEADAMRALLSGGVEARRSPSGRPDGSEPPRGTRRPLEGTSIEVVRVPRGVRSAVDAADDPRPVVRSEAIRPVNSAPPSKTESVRPPAFSIEPAPIVRSARDTDALRASFRHHFDLGALDEAAQVARALVHLGIADSLEQRLASFQPEAPPSFATPLSPYLFRAFLAHDEEDLDLGRLLGAIGPAYLEQRSRPDPELGLRPHDQVSLESPKDGLPRLFAHGARAFSLTAPRLFVRTDVPGGMAHLHALPRASVCGGTLATSFDTASTLHVLGYHLSLYRDEAYLVALVPSPIELTALVMAALHLDGRVPSQEPIVVQIADAMTRTMRPELRERLRAASEDLSLPGADPRPAIIETIRRHRRAVMLTAVRAGFALSGSLGMSDRMQRMMPAVPGIAQAEMLDDLVTYSVSSSWAALRKELGIAIEPSAPHTVFGGANA